MPDTTIHVRMNAGDWAILATLSVMWGCSFFFLAVGLRELPPFTLVLTRVAFSALLLVGWAAIAGFSFRIAMLGGEPRLARCLSTVTSLGGWQGGLPGSGPGLACHAFGGSYIAVMAEASVGGDQRVQVDRLIAAVDCGRVVNPSVVEQQIEGGLIFGMAAALGATTGITANRPDARTFRDLELPRLADCPQIMVELIASDADPGGVSELGVPPVAPAIANALYAATGIRLRQLPLIPGGE
eukprot:Opistho-1_new@99712